MTVKRQVRSYVVLCASLLLLASGAGPAVAEVPGGVSTNIAKTWGTNGRVLAILPTPDGVVVAGSFTEVVDTSGRTYPVGHVARFDPSTGRFDTSWSVSTDKSVMALAAVGDVVYLGGNFRTVNGTPASALAAVSHATGRRVTSFAAQANREVNALAVTDGHLYAGGSFTRVFDEGGMTSKSNVARFDAVSGAFDAGWDVSTDGRVRSLLPDDSGSQMFVGGDFTNVNGIASAARLGLVNTTDGALDSSFKSGNTNEGARSPVFAMAHSSEGLLVAVGGSGGGCTLLDATSGATRWSKHSNGNMVAVEAFGPYAYCGGHFSGSAAFDGLTRTKLASVVLKTGETTPDAPLINSSHGVWSMAVTDDRLYVGGDFTKVNSTLQSKFGMFVSAPAITPPLPPHSLVAVSGDRAVSLTWQTPSSDGGAPLQKYRVMRQASVGPNEFLGDVKERSFVDTTAVNGSEYTYTIVARNSAGDSAPSASVAAAPNGGVFSAPGAPSALTAMGTLGAAELAWSLPDFDGGKPILGMRVYRGTTSGSKTLLTDLPPDATSYRDSQIEVGVRYYYQVSAVNEIGEGARSAQASAVADTGVPARPDLDGTQGEPEGIQLSWSISSEGSAPVDQWVIIRDGIRLTILNDGDAMSYLDGDVARGQSYSYQIKARNSFGSSRLSSLVSVAAP